MSSTARRPRSPRPTRPMRRSCSAAPGRSTPARMASPRCSCRWTCRASRRNRFDCHGQRAIGRGSLFFENVRVPVIAPARRREQGLRAGDAGLRFLARPDRPAGAGRRARRARGDLGVRGPARGVRQAAGGVPGRVASAGRFRHPGRGRAPAVPADAVAEGQGRAAQRRGRDVQMVGARSSPTTPSTNAC